MLRDLPQDLIKKANASFDYCWFLLFFDLKKEYLIAYERTSILFKNLTIWRIWNY